MGSYQEVLEKTKQNAINILKFKKVWKKLGKIWVILNTHFWAKQFWENFCECFNEIRGNYEISNNFK